MTEKPPIPAGAFAELNAWVRSFDPEARGLRLVYQSHGMEGVIPMPYEVAGKPAEEEGASELTASILRVLGKLKPGDTLNRAGLAFEIDEMLDHTNGHFNRILKKLREDGKITSEGGYQLARKK